MSLGADKNLTDLPIELPSLVFSQLWNRDIKSLRLTCTFLKEIARLRLNRVFLSANPTNIDVFYSIANHNTFRKEITEIIYDDARFASFYGIREFFPDEIDEDAWTDSIKVARSERPDHIARTKQINSQPPLKICCQYYQDLLQQQDEVLISRSDEEAFIFGLEQFPALKRVTITPAAHGWLYAPLYETHMIRAFPYGFNYLIPRGWPIHGNLHMPPSAGLWEDMTEREKGQWRGFRIITRALAQVEHNISELIIDVNQLPTELNCTIFNNPCEEYNNLVTILSKPGLRRLDLSLIVGGQEHFGWPAFRDGYIRRALSKAKDLEHFSLSATLEADPSASLRSTVPGGGGSMAHFIPLQSVFPVLEWPNLQ
ncbi:hypothetical protein Plec18167_007737 [Paecilomyces lecythidis]|uniref:F-box domain-containing protein n=1 Tax=Paecilomyces lecythidis TaxID=3004212 RepID=A0ABR3X270_9EURO